MIIIVGVKTERENDQNASYIGIKLTTKQLNIETAYKIPCCPSPLDKEPDYPSLELKDSSKM